MIITVLAPEVLLAKAAGDLQHARLDHVEMKRFAEEDEVPWTLTHALFANMGGFVIRRAENREHDTHSKSNTSRDPFRAGQNSPPDPYHVMGWEKT